MQFDVFTMILPILATGINTTNCNSLGVLGTFLKIKWLLMVSSEVTI